MKLLLVRHAPPLVEAGVCYGRSDVPADADATRALAERLDQALPSATPVRCSPLVRCAAVAADLARLRPDIAVASDARIAEMDFGAWELRRWDTLGPGALDAWQADFADHRPGQGEAVRGFMARVAMALAEEQARGRDCAWITHAGVIRAVRLLAQGVRVPATAADWPREPIAFGALVEVALA